MSKLKITATEPFGQEPSVPTKQCPKCRGRGYYGGYTKGSGRDKRVFPPLKCPRCGGSGKVVAT